MVKAVLFILAIQICQTIFAHPIDATIDVTLFQRKSLPVAQQNAYWKRRQQMMLDEQQQSLGGKLVLNPIEAKANQVLMRAKSREIHDGSIFLSFTIASSRLNTINLQLIAALILFAIK